MSFERGNFSEASSLQARAGDLQILSSRAYDGRRSVRARWFGGSHGAQRVWRDTDWIPGTNVWYGMAVFIPTSTNYCYWNPIRWDNYDVYGGVDDRRAGTGDLGGLAIEGDRLIVMKGTYGGQEHHLLDGGPMPKGRWVWLEMHQKLSNKDGEALSELYVDGVKRGATTKANTNGRRITDLRAGAVAIAASCSGYGSVDFDRVSISNRQRGPLR